MIRPRVLLLIIVAAAGLAVVWRELKGQATHFTTEGDRRLAEARRASEEKIRARFRTAQLPYPPREIFLRAFKHEGELELWAREAAGPFHHVGTWPIVTASGGPGPKRREGDRQVPEGFYLIDRFNAESLYHLSLGINYPNASDRIRSDPKQPGSEIFIHGRDRTIGCLPLGDAAIEELFLVALDTHRRGQRDIPVHIFPARMSAATWDAFAQAHASHRSFWDELRPGHDYFEQRRQLPSISVDPAGRYTIAPGQAP